MMAGWFAAVACVAWRLLPDMSSHSPALLPASDSHSAGDNESGLNRLRLAAMMESMDMVR